MLLLEEIVVEIAMIVAVIVAVGCLTYLLQLSVREHVYLRRLRRRSEAATLVRVDVKRPQSGPSEAVRTRRDAAVVWREKRA
jgi:hypothetical protein